MRTAFEFCNEWKLACVNQQGRSAGTIAGLICWVRPPVRRLKLNIDVAIVGATSFGPGLLASRPNTTKGYNWVGL